MLCPQQLALAGKHGDSQPATQAAHFATTNPHIQPPAQGEHGDPHNEITNQPENAAHEVQHKAFAGGGDKQPGAHGGENATKHQQRQLHAQVAARTALQMQALAGLFHPYLLIGGFQRLHLPLALVGHDVGLRQPETALTLSCHYRDIPAAFQLAIFNHALQLDSPADIIATATG